MIKAVAASGQLGTGFKEATLVRAAQGADFIGCDSGSTDPGPYYLGSGESQAASTALRRDLELMIREGLRNQIPVLVGSAGTAGGTPHLDRIVGLVRDIARDRGWNFRLGVIDSEIAPGRIVDALSDGILQPLVNAPDLDERSIRGMSRIVAMQGPECFIDALEQGAQVIIAGRASDTAIFAAVPLMRGIPEAVAFHAAKVLECGAASAVERKHPDAMVAYLDADGFMVEPPNPEMMCTPQSVAAHSLYENADPFRLVEPGGALVTAKSQYVSAGERGVRVTGSEFEPASQYTVKLEAATLIGYRTTVIAGVRDPLVVEQIEDFLSNADEEIRKKVSDSMGFDEDQYTIRWLIYGKNASLGVLEQESGTSHEVGVFIDVVAPDQEVAHGIATIAWHTALHYPISEYSGLQSNLAFPVSPPTANAGAVYEFSMNHVMRLDDPRDAYVLTMEEL